MAKNVTKYSIFLGSPSDLEEERIEVENAIKELNIIYGNRNNLILDVLKWETHSAPGITESYTQDIINEDIGLGYDIFVGLIWQKFGTKTNVANSGTEEEFLNALKRFKNKENIQILFYFKNKAPLALSDINPEELSKINNFKKVLRDNNVFYGSFNDLDELKANLRIHLPKRIDNLISNSIKVDKSLIDDNDTSIQSTDEHSVLEEDFGLFDYLLEFERLLSNSTVALTKINESTNIIGEEMGRKADEIERFAQYPNPNKNLIVELFKRISKIMNDYSERIKVENIVFYSNFKDAIEIGLKYVNSMEYLDKDQYKENLESTLESIEDLQENIPLAINSMSGLHNSVKSLPNLQSNLNASKRGLDKQLDEFIFSLKGVNNLTNEFISEIKYKLSTLR
ncbi:hypothetical protein [Chryseobacterium oncorhynchi]|uniref:DUF4062 domain-containing protein n=1 Tax=Chryseobacterium oncorhynchi TaxID=741074 RepID=A0A316X5L4_9FLAO|nr:hypothetical protein [Chryseobacterium oncorhynchi]PWN66070.1 hypothetical protein C1638_006735 [Chryseobacterium oncorhynchi]